MIAKNVLYYDSSAYETGAVVKASLGVLHRISGYNSHASPVFVQLHDATSMPANGAVPVITFVVAAASNFDFDLSEIGRLCEKGIVVCSSSTGPTKTLSGATSWLNIQYT